MPTKASQAKLGRSLANPVEIVYGVASQRKTSVHVRSASTSKGDEKSPVKVPPKEPNRLKKKKKKKKKKKMEQDSVKAYNRFENLLDGNLADEEMEADCVPSYFQLILTN